MELFALAVLFLYPVFVFTAFFLFPPRNAVFISYIVAWLYLPLLTVDLPGLPRYGKFTAVNLVILPFLIARATDRIRRIRWHFADLAVVVWILVPFASSLSNGLGAYDGLSGVTTHILTYGVPYFSGRTCLQSSEDWLGLQRFLIIGALSYVPLALFEMRISPQLHSLVYGSSGRSSWENNGAFGPFGWQPTVFMNSVFELAMMFSVAALFSFVTIRGSLPSWISPYHKFLTYFLMFMVLICKKWSTIVLIGFGSMGLLKRSRLTLLCILFIPILYMTLFTSGTFRGESLYDQIAPFSERRAQSLQTRINNDIQLVEKALQRPYLGWGGWGRNRIVNEDGRDVSITDSLWMIYLGQFGLVGLISQTLIFLLPALGFAWRYDRDSSQSRTILYRSGYVASLILGLHLIDNLFNGFPNSIYPILAGGVASIFVSDQSYDWQETYNDHELNGSAEHVLHQPSLT